MIHPIIAASGIAKSERNRHTVSNRYDGDTFRPLSNPGRWNLTHKRYLYNGNKDQRVSVILLSSEPRRNHSATDVYTRPCNIVDHRDEEMNYYRWCYPIEIAINGAACLAGAIAHCSVRGKRIRWSVIESDRVSNDNREVPIARSKLPGNRDRFSPRFSASRIFAFIVLG